MQSARQELIMKISKIVAGISALTMVAGSFASVSADTVVSEAPVTTITQNAETPAATKGTDITKPEKHQVTKGSDVTKPEKPQVTKGSDVTKPERPQVTKGSDITKPEKPQVTKGTDITKHEVTKNTDVTKHTKPEITKNTDVTKPTKPEVTKNTDVTKPGKPEVTEGTDVTKPAKPEKDENKESKNKISICDINLKFIIDWTKLGEYDELEIPEDKTSLTIDELLALVNFTDLKEIKVDIKNKNFKSVDGVLYDKDMKVLISYPDAKTDAEYTIPEGVEKIAKHAFDNCKHIEKVKLPDSLREIEGEAFKDSALKEVAIPDTMQKIDDEAFLNAKKLEKVQIGKGVKKLGKKAFGNCENLKEATLPEGLKVIEEGTFEGSKNIESINVPKHLENVKDHSLVQCIKLDDATKEAIEKITDLVYGDITGDDKADITDLTYVALNLLKEKSLDEIQKVAGDVLDDDEINLADLTTLKQFILGDKVTLGPVL